MMVLNFTPRVFQIRSYSLLRYRLAIRLMIMARLINLDMLMRNEGCGMYEWHDKGMACARAWYDRGVV